MGAILALEAAVRLDLKVKAIVIIGGTARFCAADDYPSGFPVRNLRAMKLGMKRDPVSTLQTFFADVSSPRQETQESINRRVERARSFGDDTLVHGLQFLQNIDLRSALADITLPVLVLHGSRDTVIPISAASFLHHEIPHSTFCSLPGAGHDMIVTHSEKVAEKIRNFVSNGRVSS